MKEYHEKTEQELVSQYGAAPFYGLARPVERMVCRCIINGMTGFPEDIDPSFVEYDCGYEQRLSRFRPTDYFMKILREQGVKITFR